MVCIVTGQSGGDWPLWVEIAFLESLLAASLASLQDLRPKQQLNALNVALLEELEARFQTQRAFCLFRSSRTAGSHQVLDPSLALGAFLAFLPRRLPFHFDDLLETETYYVSRLLLLATVMCLPYADEGFSGVQVDAPLAAPSEESCRPISLHEGAMEIVMMCCLIPAAHFAIWLDLGS